MIKTIITKGVRLIFRKQTSILSAATIIMGTVFASRILGLFRDRLLVSYFSKEALGVYLAAFRLPNLLFELLIIGSLSTAFIPVFTGYLTKKKEAEGFAMTAHLINVSTFVVMVLSVLLFVFAVPMSRVLTPGFSPAEIEQMAFFTRVILLGQVLPLVIGNFFTGILQSYQRFLIPALAPVVYNIGILAGIVLLAPTLGLLGPAIGVIFGAFLFLGVQIPFVMQLGYRHQWGFALRSSGVASVIRLMIPRTLGLAVSQIDTIIDLVLASFLGPGSVTIFYLAQHLQQFPIGLFGSTVAQASLPALTSAATNHDAKKFENMFLASYHQILFLVLPFSMIFLVLRIPIVRLVFGAARFDWQGTVLTGETLAYFTISLFAQSLIHLFVRGFYALHDTKTPVSIGMVSVGINSVLSILFIKFFHWDVWALALSTSIASIINFLALMVFLDHKVNQFDRYGLFIPPLKMIIATFVAGVFLYVPLKLFDQLIFDTTLTFELFLLTGVATVSGFSAYLFSAWVLAIEEVTTFFNLAKRIKRVPQLIFTHPEELVDGSEKSLS